MTPWLTTEHMLVTPWLTVAALLAASGYLARVAWRLWPRRARPMSAAARRVLAGGDR